MFKQTLLVLNLYLHKYQHNLSMVHSLEHLRYIYPHRFFNDNLKKGD